MVRLGGHTLPGSGEPVLWGYAHLKAAHDADSPVVKAGLKSALLIVADIGKEDPNEKHSASIYNAVHHSNVPRGARQGKVSEGT